MTIVTWVSVVTAWRAGMYDYCNMSVVTVWRAGMYDEYSHGLEGWYA